MILTLTLTSHTSLPNGQPAAMTLDRSGIHIGRAAYVDWQLPDPQRWISSEHCEIVFDGTDYVLKDKSSNGTAVNGERIDVQSRTHTLRDGDVIAIGHYEIQAALSGTAPLPLAEQGGDIDSVFGAYEGGAPPAAPEEIRRDGPRRPAPVYDPGTLGVPFAPPEAAHAAAVPRASGASDEASFWGSFAGGSVTEAAPPAAAPFEEAARPQAPAAGRAYQPPPALGAASDALGYFLQGAGLDAGALAGDPAAAREAGLAFRQMAAGLRELLKELSEQKAVLGVERTQITLAGNNSFKFAASVDDLLMRLIRPQDGDLAGAESVERAFADIRGHNQRLLTAMSEAVRRIVQNLSPQEIKRREDGGVIGAIIPGSRKAAWWDELEKEHAALMEDNQARLEELIGEELRNAFAKHL